MIARDRKHDRKDQEVAAFGRDGHGFCRNRCHEFPSGGAAVSSAPSSSSEDRPVSS